jgi:competence protein ComEA
MLPDVWAAARRHASHLAGSRFAKPVGKVLGVTAGLLLLALVGHSAAGSMADARIPAAAASAAAADSGAQVPALAAAPQTSALQPDPAPTDTSSSGASPPRAPASPQDPVTLNTATFEDLRRLPGVGAKRANAILALRTHLGRFRTIDDLLKVKGIGRSMLKRLRPLVRLDPVGLVLGERGRSPEPPPESDTRSTVADAAAGAHP